ncbi:hypothetical protein [Pseudomonas defluvii]|uniref:hypothetical protein n=1 Tax=Pseudomonas defluvii TaxID=1876757 RepID=UPI00081181D8|nr:hypothetical protein [Pseudomonas defluvii]
MPAPDSLIVQTPGEPVTTTAQAVDPAASTTTSTESQPPVTPTYTAKHNGGGRWKIWYTPIEGQADWFSDFVAIGDGAKEQAEAEAQRLNDGGEPLVIDARRDSDRATLEQRQPTTAQAVDPTTIKQAVMTSEGWLCPEPAAKE